MWTKEISSARQHFFTAFVTLYNSKGGPTFHHNLQHFICTGLKHRLGLLKNQRVSRSYVSMSSFTIWSPAFGNNQTMPKKYTADGENISPTLEWSGVPAGTKSLVLINDDPDAPDPKAPKFTFVHWVVYNIPSNCTKLEEGTKPGSASWPQSAKEALNDFKKTSYGGPAPPIGIHRYFFKLYALDTSIDTNEQLDKKKIESLMEGHTLGQTQVVGLYSR
jgi:Raf kinase inhibitor-like YbhB/YbcL family protein